jgi:septum site-determining protein MinD
MGSSIIVSSGKGGTGKTNVIVNLGVALAKTGKKVVLVDGSLTTPDISLHLGIPFHVHGLSHILKENASLKSATFSHKSGLQIIPGNIHIDVLKECEGKKFSKVLEKLKKENDIVLIDSAAGLGREAISTMKHCDKCIIVVNPELTSVVNASKVIQIAKNEKVKPIGIILNRIGKHKKELKEKDIKSLLHNIQIIGRIPEDKHIVMSTKNEESILDYYPSSSVSREFKKIANSLTQKRKKQKSFLEHIVSFFN